MNTQRTQRSNTAQSYHKVAQYIRTNFIGNFSVLDYGAGLGHGTAILKDVSGQCTDSFEPNPNNWNPTYTKVTQIKKMYNIIVCLNVLNVLPPQPRAEAVQRMYDILSPNGALFIGTRKWKGDVDQTKNFTHTTEPKSVYTQGTYQRGFDGDELKECIQSIIPVEIISTQSMFCKNSIICYK